MTMTKDLYELGDAPPLGTAPKQMYASLIRQERYGRPVDAFRTEVVDVPPVGPGQVLVKVMAAGVNYNNVWAALGEPLDVIAARQKQGATEDFHIGGSDLSGIVWAVGDGVRLKPGAEVVVLACRWDESAEDIRLGADPVTSSTQRVWGYEENYGSFAQFAVVDEYMCHPKPQRLSWAAASCYMATAATAYRQLFGWEPHTVRPGDPVLIWGGAGGLGSIAIQLVRHVGGIPVAVVSSEERGEFCMRLGAKGWIDRREFDHWGRLPDTTDEEAMKQWLDGARAFGRRFWEVLGERRAPRIVLEHSGADTIPTSIYMADNAGMVVICGGTTGYNGDVDLRFLWMRQKRLQGSHVASAREAREITRLIDQGAIDPCLSRTFGFEEIGLAHQLIHDNQHPSGNMAVLVNATE
ncbi:crotonyl-CoA carboxylase/reductase [Streptomyces albidoflavus]|uniref:Crotonyl-CoA carboxylase/reductase n=5 Tax=Streptomyces TaxID=1883 RepID=A0ACC7Y5C7_9ACTN|nr:MULTISPECIES: crotonyl-CoA carboxylase/reductase [Streptomyces]ALN66828.1 SomE [Streptomyces somaliensis]MYQ69696.1 crotonyl-CoA carboxylase/reductase [Streptomyces sp. SID4934]MYW60441.1 crotonyl-CoA carboxylase/reductase [Streptomyces sp. SID8370]MYW86199.1 crotonyl-CoA carboxylase/reductase [Streptomyces sp. SID8371]NUW06648.1 crotonyl-CoA carboxylase/reductase [Streptomyces sp. CAI-21]NVI30429.1 crotonyl-CoA carboxylase/reductase [Streptomyces sp. CAI-17]SCD98088.1 crotonyl-CoA carbox